MDINQTNQKPLSHSFHIKTALEECPWIQLRDQFGLFSYSISPSGAKQSFKVCSSAKKLTKDVGACSLFYLNQFTHSQRYLQTWQSWVMLFHVSLRKGWHVEVTHQGSTQLLELLQTTVPKGIPSCLSTVHRQARRDDLSCEALWSHRLFAYGEVTGE